MRKLLVSLTLAALCGIAGAARAETTPDFEYHGYLRSGVGASRGGTDQTCFSAVDASAKFRLGNECETYGEASFVKNSVVGKSANAPVFSTHLLFAFVSKDRHDWESTQASAAGNDAELTIALREAFVSAKGVLGAAQPWVGKRFYRRQDIHILDYYVLNNSGPGFGVESIPLGFANLNTALTRNTPGGSSDAPAQNNLDLRLSDIELGGAGKLELVVIEGGAGKRGHSSATSAFEAVSGTQVGVIHNVSVLGGFNRVTLQYGQGLFGGTETSTPTGVVRQNRIGDFGDSGAQGITKGDKATLDARKKSSTTRFVEELVGQFGAAASASFVVLYQTTDFGGIKELSGKEAPKKSELMAGVRPVININDLSSVALEAGTVKVTNAFVDSKGYQDATLNKLTIAPQITAGDSFWARPSLRLFGTYASWNKEAKGKIGGATYASATNGFSTGAQLEAWW
jgi:maltoporin